MNNTACPHCQALTITPLERFKAGKWATIFCPQCGGRICMQPFVLAALYFVHTWNVLGFGFFLVYERDPIYLVAMIIVWLLIEFFVYYIPLSRMRAKKVTG